MPTSTVPRWMEGIARHIKCSASFIRAMDEQLAKEFRAKTGLELSDFVIADTAEGWKVRRNGLIGSIEADIVGSRLGFPVTIAWADRGDQRFIEPHDQVTPDGVQFWWHELPVDEILEEEATWPEPPFDVTRFPFPIDFKLKIWPHVRFTIGLRQAVTDELRARLTDLLRRMFDDWKRAGKPGTFHDIGVAERVDDRTLKVDIDLGSTGPAGMAYVLERLASTSFVASVMIRAY